MRTVGIILTIIGLIAFVLFGYHALQESESISLFGAEIAVSTANWTPVIISGLVLLVGIIITASARKGKR